VDKSYFLASSSVLDICDVDQYRTTIFKGTVCSLTVVVGLGAGHYASRDYILLYIAKCCGHGKIVKANISYLNDSASCDLDASIELYNLKILGEY